MKKVSILTPTYNDSDSIEETLKSLVEQTYDNWEWIVINDGSTDETEGIIKSLIDKFGIADKCKYIYQDNADQLNAIIHGAEYITGDYVFALHSDDLLPHTDFLKKCVEYMDSNPDIDGLFGDLLLINENSEIIGRQHVKEYCRNESDAALMLLWLGRNLYSDVAFHKTSVYKEAVMQNYLKWNMPLWIDLRGESVKMLNYTSVPYPVLKYRIHGGNYINNDLGRMNVINGELRTATELMRFYSIPQYKMQYVMYRLMNKISPGKSFHLRYRKKETKDKYSIVEYIIKKRYPEGVGQNIFLESVLEFYKKESQRVVHMNVPEGLRVYYGKDVRSFNKKMIDNTLESFYSNFMDEMKMGFLAVVVDNDKDVDTMKNILKFFCISHVDVRRE